MTDTSKALAIRLLSVLHRDRPRLERIDRYARGDHDDPYMPANADSEYRMLARRAVTNWIPLLVSTPAQALYVDDFRRADQTPGALAAVAVIGVSPEMRDWQKSRLDARQSPVHRGALTFGHSFVITEKVGKGVRSRGLSALNTSALFEDPANDDVPYAALTVTRYPKPTDDSKKVVAGKAIMWDGTNEYKVTFKSLGDIEGVSIVGKKPHGYFECPVTRFAPTTDLEGRTVGVVEPAIPLQDRINQTVFDLLVTQTYASFKVRWVTGMAPPLKMELLDADGNVTNNSNEAVDQRVALDDDRKPIPEQINYNAKRFLFAEDHEAKFGTLDETPLDGFIASIEASIRHLAAISQTPPHHLLGQIANLSAEALLAAETALARKVEEFRHAFGESWERVFRVSAYLAGRITREESEEDFGEVLWRDMEQRSLAQSADALGKLAESLGIPKEALWERVPGVTATEIQRWRDKKAEEPDNRAYEEMANLTGSGAPPVDGGFGFAS